MWPFKSTNKSDAMILEYLTARSPNTQRSYQGILKEFKRSLGSVSIESAREINALRYINECRSRGASPSTIRRKVVILSSIFDYLKRNGTAKLNPFDKLIETLPRGGSGMTRPHGLLSNEEIRKLLTAPSIQTKIGIRDRAIFALLFGGALRISEVVSLNLEAIKVHQSGAVEVRIGTTKAGCPQKAVLSDQLSGLVLRYLKHRIAEGGSDLHPLIVMYDANLVPGSRMSVSTLRRLIKGYYRVVGVSSSMTVHSCRATAITRLLEAGVPYREVQEFSRHSSVQMVERYDKRRFEIDEHPGRKLKY